MQNLQMPLDQAFSIISQALAQANSNREGHALMQTAENRVRQEIEILQNDNDMLRDKIEELQKLLPVG